jgi:MoxR-like ATPase
VVLIDEIDKADIDFPNDLLLELDECRFFVEEMDNQEIRAKEPPIIFITSNDEKDLPDAFLRRCLFHYVEFPKDEALVKILENRFPEVSQELVNKAITRFAELRKKMQENQGNVKKVSTSELIDWFTILQEHETDEILKELEGTLPFCSVLLKSWGDHRQYLGKKD